MFIKTFLVAIVFVKWDNIKHIRFELPATTVNAFFLFWPIHILNSFVSLHLKAELDSFVTDSTILMRGLRPAGLTVGRAAADAAPSPATIRRLWERGRNLTREEILLKVDLILSGRIPATGPR